MTSSSWLQFFKLILIPQKHAFYFFFLDGWTAFNIVHEIRIWILEKVEIIHELQGIEHICIEPTFKTNVQLYQLKGAIVVLVWE